MLQKSIFIVMITMLCAYGQTKQDSIDLGLEDSVNVTYGTDLFKDAYAYHTTWGVVEIATAGVALGWIAWDSRCAGGMKMVHAYVGFATLILGVRGVWDINMGRQNQKHFLQFKSFYPTGVHRTNAQGKDRYDLVLQ